jgi:hypothetical protein
MTNPTDEEIMELMPQQLRDDLSHAARAIAGFDPANIKAAGAMRIILNRHAVNHVRAALAKYGSTTPQLVAEGATDDKLMDIARATDLVYYMGEDCGFASPYMEGTDITAEVLAYARAVLAKWGHQ